AGSRVVIYRKDYFKKAGITKTPTSLSQLVADGKKLMSTNSSDKTFSAFYVAGPDWYSAMSFVYDFGGQIATSQGGQWTGTLDQHVSAPPRQGDPRRAARHGRQVDVVRPDREELGERRECERAASHAHADPHGQAVRAVCGSVGQQADHLDAEREHVRKPSPLEHERRRRRSRTAAPAASSYPPFLHPLRCAVRADRARDRGHRGDPRLSALLPRPAVAAALRPLPADRAQGLVRRPAQLRHPPARPGLLADAPPHDHL